MGEIFDFSVKTNSLSRAALSEDEGDIFNIHYGDILVKYNEVVDPIYDRVPKIRDGTTINLMEAVLKDGDVVFADAAEDLMVGKVVEVTNMTNNPTVAGLHTIVARPQIKFSDYYLGYYFNSHYFHKRIKYVAQGTKVFSISKHVLEQLMMEFPQKIEEQKSIVKLLGGLSRDITVQQRKSVSKDEVMNLFLCKSNALVDVDVYANSWEQRRLGEVTDIKTGSRNHQDSVKNGEFPFFVRSEKIEQLNEYDFDTSAILVPGDGRIGEIFHYYEGKFALHQRVYKIDNFNGVDPQYLLSLLRRSFKRHALRLNAQGTVPSLRLPMFTNWDIVIPKLEEQQRVGQFFKQLDHHITFQQRM